MGQFAEDPSQAVPQCSQANNRLLMRKQDTSYWADTHSPLYSFIFTLPLFILYELGTLVLSGNDMMVIRNGADVLMRQVLGLFGIYGMYGFSATFMVGFSFAFLRQKKAMKSTVIQGEYLILMFFESVFWSTCLYIILGFTQTIFMNPGTKRVFQQVVLSLGAGIYEEFVFRVILITGLAAILGFILQWKKSGQKIGAILIASGIFSAFHFIGTFGDDFSARLLIIRIFAGILLGIIYTFRGFGVAAYTHAMYDLAVLVVTTTHGEPF